MSGTRARNPSRRRRVVRVVAIVTVALAANAPIVAAFAGGRALWAALLAPGICLFVSCTPIVLWLAERAPPRRGAGTAPLRLDEDDDVLAENTA